MTALNLTPDEALALADQWCAGLTMDADSKGWGAILLVLATEVRRLRAENERLRADAARGRLLIDRGEWIRHRDDDRPSDSHALLAVRLPYDADLSCRATREDAIDKAMEASNAG